MRTAARRPGRPYVIDYDDLPNSAMYYRDKAGKTRKEVCDELRVTQQSLCEFELHGNGLGKDLRWKLSFLLKVPYEKMLKPGKNFADKIRERLDTIR
jgi:hypothetical protein